MNSENAVSKIIDLWGSRKSAMFHFEDGEVVEVMVQTLQSVNLLASRNGVITVNLPAPEFSASVSALELMYGVKLLDLIDFLSKYSEVRKEEWLAEMLVKTYDMYNDEHYFLYSIECTPENLGFSLWRGDRGEPSLFKPSERAVRKVVKEIKEKLRFESNAFFVRYDSKHSMMVDGIPLFKVEEAHVNIEMHIYETRARMLLPAFADLEIIDKLISLSFLEGVHELTPSFARKLIEKGINEPMVRALGSTLGALRSVYRFGVKAEYFKASNLFGTVLVDVALIF